MEEEPQPHQRGSVSLVVNMKKTNGMDKTMKSFKHIISYACDKRCSYCINEILAHDEKQCKNQFKIGQAYVELALDGYEHIMLSGGEPVLNKMFETCLGISSMIFEHVSIISAHQSTLSNKLIEEKADDVLFSFHNEYLDDVNNYKVEIDIPIYASMIVETYDILEETYGNVELFLISKGFSGLTVRQCYPDGKELIGGFNTYDGFSTRYYKNNRCVEESLLLLPDLSTTTQKEFA